MTERSPRRARWSPARIRATAWFAGTATALGTGAALAAAPMPSSGPAAPAGRRDAPLRRVIERHVIRRIVIVEDATAAAPVSAPTIVVQAPAPAPAPALAPAPTSTGGS